jgi:hypothetical protein
MNGFITKTVGGLCLGAGLSVVAGCVHYRQAVDPCWPERYNYIARANVRDAFNAQTYNGHILDQTMWDYYFATDKEGKPGDVLNEAGIARLQYLARRRPTPDLHLYLQTAQTIPYAPGSPEKTILARQELDQRRIQAIQAYMTTKCSPAGINAPLEVTVIDPAPVGLPAIPIGGAFQPGRDLPIIGADTKLWLNFQGSQIVNVGTGGGGAGSGGGGGTGSGGGGAGGGSGGGAGGGGGGMGGGGR